MSLVARLKKERLKRKGIFCKFPEEVALDIIAEKPVYFYGRVAASNGVTIGKYTYVNSGFLGHGISIGRYCSLSYNVSIGPQEHPTRFLSTYTALYAEKEYLQKTRTGKTVIGNDVWVGMNAVVLRNVTVGDGAIIGAGAVVTRDVPPYAIALGVPARVVKYRFDKETREALLQLKWWEREHQFLKSLPFNNIDACISILRDTDPKC
jgi:virginiamycin A acetyltransferase